MLDRPTTITGGLSETQPFCVACRHASCFARPLCNARFARLIACCCSLCSPPRLLVTVHISLARQPTPGLLASLASFAASPVVCFNQLARCARLLSLTSFASSPRLLLVHLAARSARLGPGSSLRSPGSSLRSRLLFASLARLLLACLLLAWQLTPESRVCCSFRQHCLACPRWNCVARVRNPYRTPM